MERAFRRGTVVKVIISLRHNYVGGRMEAEHPISQSWMQFDTVSK